MRNFEGRKGAGLVICGRCCNFVVQNVCVLKNACAHFLRLTKLWPVNAAHSVTVLRVKKVYSKWIRPAWRRNSINLNKLVCVSTYAYCCWPVS